MKTHCKRGHAMTPDNIRIRIQHGKYTQRNCKRCEAYHQAKRDRAKVGRFEAYEPIENILDRPIVRVLRVLRRFDWVSTTDVCLALDIDGENKAERSTVRGSMLSLTKQGHLEVDRTSGHWPLYRITPSGIRRLERALDNYNVSLDSASLADDELKEAA